LKGKRGSWSLSHEEVKVESILFVYLKEKKKQDEDFIRMNTYK